MNELALDGLLIRSSREFGSSNANHRTHLRHALLEFIKSETANSSGDDEEGFQRALSNLTNLTVRPRVPGWALSISHCATLGGFVAGQNSAGLGIDFEITNRVSEPIAVRVAPFAGEKQILEVLREGHASMALFWVAKEASIKAFGNRFPNETPHFGEVEISSIDLISRTFTARRNGLTTSGRFLAAVENADSSIVGAIANIS